jgi:3-oxoacyl-[acyl-carrier protein] reductase
MRIVVTGGSGGIGRAVCARLRASGHSPVVVDRTPPADPGLPYFAADALQSGQVGSAVRETALHYGAVDAVVNSIGIYESRTLEEFTWPSFGESFAVNVRGPVEAILAWAETLPRGRPGRVVNIGSAGARVPSRDLAYATTKAALEGATRSLARSLAPRDVLVFCLAPGLVDTAMSRAMEPHRRAENIASTWLKRACSPTDVAGLVHFLLTGPTHFLTGSVIDVSGGQVSR